MTLVFTVCVDCTVIVAANGSQMPDVFSETYTSHVEKHRTYVYFFKKITLPT